LEDAVYAVRTLQLGAELDGQQALFEAKGRTLLSPGWKILVMADQAEDTEDAPQEPKIPYPP
jgi:DNA topoisomerase-1